jgi:YVTN family beta-propeller protein
MKNASILLLLLILIVSCLKTEQKPTGSFLTGDGIFIVNEGNFMAGNGSLSYFSYDSSNIYNDLFETVNGRPLGDVPNSMEINGDLGYVVVNNSGKIEVVRSFNLASVKTISGLISPRNIGFVNSSKAYVTSMYSDSVIIIDLFNNSISGYINLRRTSESIAIVGDKAYAASWVGGHEIMVIDNTTDEVIDSIQVGEEPESMVVDHNNMLWVLCNGGWARENFAELDGINTVTDEIENHIVFPDKQQSPTCLRIDGDGQNLFYIENGVWKMSISNLQFPARPFIPQSGHYFYKLGVNPVNNDIFITDAVDYQQNGYLLCFTGGGALVSEFRTDIIPGSMCFRLADK